MFARDTRDLVSKSLRDGAELRLELDKCATTIIQAAEAIGQCLQRDGTLFLFGNGGSAADAQHIAAEFVGRFVQDRIPLPAIALTTDSSVLTAIGNDFGFEQVFARQVRALGKRGDVVVAISTSGQSPNILSGVEAGRELGLTTIGLTGGNGGRLSEIVDIALIVPSRITARIQECHISLGHIICEVVESLLFEKAPD
jgi:D-sedoheptulose 7-phosphate isomerase